MSLLTPADLGGWRLPNRVVPTRARGSVPTDLQTSTTRGERAVGFRDVPGVYPGEQVAGWRRVTDVVHALGGRIVPQLWHTGAVSHADLLGARPAGPSAVDPEETVYLAGGRRRTEAPRELSVEEIRRIVEEHRTPAAEAGARRRRRRGRDRDRRGRAAFAVLDGGRPGP